MRPNFRSISGAALMLIIIPIFAGLLACMPEYVPLGNPERARIDENMSGLWFVEGAEDMEGLLGHIVFLQPWDKRTWIISNVLIQDSYSVDLGEHDISTYQGFVDLFESPEFDDGELELGVMQYKGWLAKLGGETFLTWEIRVVVDKPEQLLEPWYWQDFRVTERTEDRMVWHLIDTAFPPLEEAPETKRGWEKVVRKYADDDALYYDETITLQRVKDGDIKLFAELVNRAAFGPMD